MCVPYVEGELLEVLQFLQDKRRNRQDGGRRRRSDGLRLSGADEEQSPSEANRGSPDDASNVRSVHFVLCVQVVWLCRCVVVV